MVLLLLREKDATLQRICDLFKVTQLWHDKSWVRVGAQPLFFLFHVLFPTITHFCIQY